MLRKRGIQGQQMEARDAGLIWAMGVVTGDRGDGGKLDAMETQRSNSCWPMGARERSVCVCVCERACVRVCV